MPQPSTSSGIPPSDVTVSTSSRVSVACSARSGATSFSTPVDVSACTTATSRACGVVALRVEQPLRIERGTPRRVDSHHLGAAATRDLAHPLAEDAVHPDDDGVAGLDQVDEARLHAGGARSPRSAGSARSYVRKTVRRRSQVSSRIVRKSGSRWPSSGRANAAATSGYGLDGPGPSSRRSVRGIDAS